MDQRDRMYNLFKSFGTFLEEWRVVWGLPIRAVTVLVAWLDKQ